MPILANVLLAVAGQRSSAITATDLEVELVAEAEVERADGTGEITVPAASCSTSVRALPEGTQVDDHARTANG